jgi:formylglycine-generating enzyme required for sulfatase activity
MPPVWAQGYGYDGFGPFAEVFVGEVKQRFRWAPPGWFLMGSPPGEAGRDPGEVQHEVELTHGFWIADTPVTQALWQAVMGSNPSRFVHPERPVERVSWDDAQAFIARLNEQQPGLELSLPTEAQWEYACRAGTTTATYAGDLEIVASSNAPVLDAIAWYGGNSGVDFDLAEGQEAYWSEKQYEFSRTGTRIVGLKRPNPWGLYDALGNVWEWCADWFDSYQNTLQADPSGPDRGARRVIRGGSWSNTARNVRAAFRDAYSPDFRYEILGFRLSRGHAPQPAERPSGGAGGSPGGARP